MRLLWLDCRTWHAKVFVIHSLLFVFILLFIMFEGGELFEELSSHVQDCSIAIIIFIAWMSSDNPPLFFAIEIERIWHTNKYYNKAQTHTHTKFETKGIFIYNWFIELLYPPLSLLSACFLRILSFAHTQTM